VGHGSWVKWVTIFGWVTWVVGHCQWPIDPWWWNNCTVACAFLFLVDIKKLFTHSISPHYHSKRLYFNLRFFALKLSSTTMPRPLLVPCVGWNDVMAMGRVWWVMWVMGQLCDGSHGSWVTKDDPFQSLFPGATTAGMLCKTHCCSPTCASRRWQRSIRCVCTFAYHQWVTRDHTDGRRAGLPGLSSATQHALTRVRKKTPDETSVLYCSLNAKK